jgi:hypothetical protein
MAIFRQLLATTQVPNYFAETLCHLAVASGRNEVIVSLRARAALSSGRITAAIIWNRRKGSEAGVARITLCTSSSIRRSPCSVSAMMPGYRA